MTVNIHPQYSCDLVFLTVVMYNSRLIWHEPYDRAMRSVLSIGGFGELGELDVIIPAKC